MTENELKPQQIQVAELLAAGETVTSAASLVNCTRQTIHRWLNDDADFVACIAALKNEQIEAVRNRVRHGAARAAAIIEDLMENSQNDSIRLAAAKELLSVSGAFDSTNRRFDDDADNIRSIWKSEANMKSAIM
jgi:hypothetical protein